MIRYGYRVLEGTAEDTIRWKPRPLTAGGKFPLTISSLTTPVAQLLEGFEVPLYQLWVRQLGLVHAKGQHSKVQ